ncbi:MAG: Fpg/Nei family DNA glycosylase [Phycisphaerales bacterium]
MPELPDIELYLDVLRPRVVGQAIRRVRLRNPFLLRSVSPPDPPLDAAEGRRVVGVRRIGKRVVLGLDGDLFLVFHLMIAGRFRWRAATREPARTGPSKPPGAGPKSELVHVVFDAGVLVLNEAGTKRRASLHVVSGEATLAAHDPGGVEPLTCGVDGFAAAVRRENHTLKRSLTDPRLISGVGNAYSDEILHAARMSPLRLSASLTDAEVGRLHDATRGTLTAWIGRLREDFGVAAGGAGRFPGPGDITAFRPGFAVHGRFGEPCPVCAAPVQRIIYAENETNYCARCQTGGKVLADRSMSRLLKDDWPRSIDELEEL